MHWRYKGGLLRGRDLAITKQGNALLAKLLSSEQLEITRVMIGGGRPAEDANLMDLETMIHPIARATSTLPLTVGTTTSFVIEYRNDMGGELLEGGMEAPPTEKGLSRDISTNEFAVFANDLEKGEIMLYYGCLGDYPDSRRLRIRRPRPRQWRTARLRLSRQCRTPSP